MPKKPSQIKWTTAARDDVLPIRRYLQTHVSPAYASKITEEIRRAVLLLKQRPDLGHHVPELAGLGLQHFRQIHADQNRIIYESSGDVLYIHLICHVRMDLAALLARRFNLTPPSPV